MRSERLCRKDQEINVSEEATTDAQDIWVISRTAPIAPVPFAQRSICCGLGLSRVQMRFLVCFHLQAQGST
jgi:hypothetical protein